MCHGQMIDDAIRKTRKAQRCDDCGCTIVPGRMYSRQVSVDHGEMGTWKGCKSCAGLNALLWDRHGEDMCYTSSARDDAREMAREDGWRKTLANLRHEVSLLFGKLSRASGGADRG